MTDGTMRKSKIVSPGLHGDKALQDDNAWHAFSEYLKQIVEAEVSDPALWR